MNYNVSGMSCAACVARVEKAVSSVDGVKSCSVSLLTASMTVEGSFSSESVIESVKAAGYEASVKKDATLKESDETASLVKRLLSSILFLAVLMYLSMGHNMLGWPLPYFIGKSIRLCGLVQMGLSFVVLVINRKFFIKGFKTLLHGSPTMDSLVALGSGISFIYSFAVLAVPGKDHHFYMNNFYFEGAAMIVTLITVGKLLEAVSKGRTTDALKSLLKLAPKNALVEVHENGQTIQKEIETSLVKPGDIFIVKPGMAIPVDGVVLEGDSGVNEAALTGEALPVDKTAGDEVSSGTMNTNGVLRCRALRTGQDTTLSQIIKMVSDASATKAPVAKMADKVSAVFVPAVIVLAVITVAVWLLLGVTPGFALSRGICVLVVSCPCALGLATPVAIMVGNGKAARNGILFKTSQALENTGRTKIVALDKTGTVTTGKMKLSSFYFLDGRAGNFVSVALYELPRPCASLPASTPLAALQSLTQLALNLEKSSEHPVAMAIVSAIEELGYIAEPVSEFEAFGGKGVSGTVVVEGQKTKAFAGRVEYALENLSLPDNVKAELIKTVQKIAEDGQTPVVLCCSSEKIALLGVADSVKQDSNLAVKLLKSAGIKTVMLTGDNKVTANKVAEQTGIEDVKAGLLPAEKLMEIETLQKKGKVTMIGDGINDAPSLTKADTGIAIGAGTDVAVDAADVVLVNGSLVDAVNAITISRRTLSNIKENLFWAFAYNVALIPVAAGVYSKAGLTMNPMLGAFAMSLSSFCVVLNALRLNLVKLEKSVTIKTEKKPKESKMTKTIKVEGMMCSHCEGHVKAALEKIEGVTLATASHEKKEVVLELTKDVEESLLEQAVTEAGYTFVK